MKNFNIKNKKDLLKALSISRSCHPFRCGHEGCSLQSHVICLAQTLVTPSCPLLPVRGPCPLCARVLVWGERVRGLSAACASSRGHNRGRGVWEATDGHTREEETESEEDEGHWTNLLTQPS